MAIPIDDEQFAVGQILVPGVKFYLGIDPEGRSSMEETGSLNLRLFSWTTDGEIYRKTWKLIGQRPVPEQFPRPDYKFEQEGETLVESFDGGVIRPFDPASDGHVRHRWSVSSALLSDAVLSFNGKGAWMPHFDKFLA